MNYQYEKDVIGFITKAHGDQKRKYTGEPYINHCIEVAELVKTACYSSDDLELMVYSALLHDVIEDTNITGIEIEAELLKIGLDSISARIIKTMVRGLTDVSMPSDGNRKVRKAIDREHLENQRPTIKTIKLADIISNTSSITQYDKGFARVYIPEKLELLKVLKEGDFNLYIRACYEVYKGKLELRL